MDGQDFEGSLVLEKLAEFGLVDDFFEAVDADDFGRAQKLMKRAEIDQETIDLVLQKMKAADNSH